MALGVAALAARQGIAAPTLVPHGAFVADYDGESAAHGVFLRGAGPPGEALRDADVILYGSSKGIYGFRAGLLQDLAAARGAPLRAFNASLGYGEGAVFLLDIVQNQDLRDKEVVVDTTDTSNTFFLTQQARAELKRDALQSAYRRATMTSRFVVDGILGSLVPRVVVSAPSIALGARLRSHNLRSATTGDVLDSPQHGAFPVQPHSFGMAIEPDRWFSDVFVPQLRARNIDIILTTVPYEGHDGDLARFDPAYVKQMAELTGAPAAAVDWAGLMTMDRVHLDASSADLFTTRLAERLFDPAINLAARISARKAHLPVKSEPTIAASQRPAEGPQLGATPGGTPSEGRAVPLLVSPNIYGHNLVAYGDRVFAVPLDGHPFDPAEALRGTYLSAVNEGTLVLEMQRRADPQLAGTPVLLQEGYRGYNLVAADAKIYGIPQGLGAFSVERFQRGDYPSAVVADSLQRARTLIDALPAAGAP